MPSLTSYPPKNDREAPSITGVGNDVGIDIERQKKNTANNKSERRFQLGSRLRNLVVVLTFLYCFLAYVLFRRHSATSYPSASSLESSPSPSSSSSSSTPLPMAKVADGWVSERAAGAGGGIARDSGSKNAAKPVATVPSSLLVTSGRRFPQYGTEEFRRTCPWTLGYGGRWRSRQRQKQKQKQRQEKEKELQKQKLDLDHDDGPTNCTVWYRPHPNWNEGLSAWSGGVVAAHLRAHQFGCAFKFDYGPGVDVTTALVPHESDYGTDMDWRVPARSSAIENAEKEEGAMRHPCIELSRESNDMATSVATWASVSNDARRRPCFVMYAPSVGPPLEVAAAADVPLDVSRNISKVPIYRMSATGPLTPVDFPGLDRDVGPGFNFTIGMACSFGRLVRLSPTASQIVPNVETELLPALRDPSVLSLALYLRTGRTDQMAVWENKGPNSTAARGLKFGSMQTKQIKCAEQLEVDMLMEASERGAPYARVVWMLVTDSPWVREEVVRLKHGQPVKIRGGRRGGGMDAAASKKTDDASAMTIAREVLTTTTRGVHTRKKRNPSDMDFAEAAVDWYLLGETDAVVGGAMYSFCKTAALRTARPYYEGFRGCTLRTLVW